MDKQPTDVSEYLLQIIKWRKINDEIREKSELKFWRMSGLTRHILNWSIDECEQLVEKIRKSETFNLPVFDPVFSETHSAGVVNYKNEDFFWKIRYYPQDEKNPCLLGSDNYKTEGWVELLEEYLAVDIDISF